MVSVAFKVLLSRSNGLLPITFAYHRINGLRFIGENYSGRNWESFLDFTELIVWRENVMNFFELKVPNLFSIATLKGSS